MPRDVARIIIVQMSQLMDEGDWDMSCISARRPRLNEELEGTGVVVGELLE